ncbi:AAA family ATPase [Streptomyces sp. NPDC087440]|uniref:helix-turn-helix transcriptional regulator n=1 Tax=Streptomyces sp. NPDC087440 TaxID=3365790 RepID=UPI00382DF39B
MAQIIDTPFVGRADELTRLTGVLDRAVAGDPRVVLVAGDAGVGKTRTLTVAAAHAAATGMTVLTGHCVDLGDVGLPYLPFTEILGTAAADERLAPAFAAHPAVQRLMGTAAGAGPGPDAGGRLQLFEGIAGLLADLADLTPLLLVVEDLHWADQSSRDLLRFLLSRGVLQRSTPGGPPHRLAVFASYRTDDLHRRHPLRPLLAELVRLAAVDRLELRPLADADVAKLVHAQRTGPVSDSAVRRIVDRAEGNAFYAEELLAALPQDDDGADSAAMPSGLADVLLIRIEQLSETAQQVLRTAAVAGRRVGHDLLRDAVRLPQEELESALREAVGHQLLVTDDATTYSFRHALTREAVYEDLLPGERVRLHGVFAALLAGEGRTANSAAERAHHSRASHDLADALAASLEAADHAQRLRAPAEELRHLEAALELMAVVDAAAHPAHSDPVTLTLRASAAAAHAGDPHRAVQLTRSALARSGSGADSELAARVRYTLAGNLMRIDNLEAAFAYSSEALALIPAEPPSYTWVWAAATHVMAARSVGRDADAERVARQALDTAERLRLTDAQADLMISLVGLEAYNRRTPQGRQRLIGARELARTAGNLQVEMRALYNLALGCYESGELDQCLVRVGDGLDRARRAGLLTSPYAVELHYLQSLLLYTLGRWDECARVAADDATLLTANSGLVTAPALYVAVARGEFGAAVDGSRALLDGPQDWMVSLVASTVLIDAAALRGDAEDCVRQVRAAVDVLTESVPTDRPDALIRLAALALSGVADAAEESRRAGDVPGVRRWTDSAAELVELARSTAAHRDGTELGPEGLAWLARARAEGVRAATGPDVAAWEQAATAFGYGEPYELARCRRRLAEALLAAARRDEAAEQAYAARDTAIRLGAVPLREALDTLIRRGRLADAPAAGERIADLTARESEVLRLLGRGLTNRQIGEELYISGKTASVHVSNILAKLGAASRTEAVGIAYREGLIEPETNGPG